MLIGLIIQEQETSDGNIAKFMGKGRRRGKKNYVGTRVRFLKAFC